MPKKIIQEHHISRDPEETVIIYKGEHMILSRIQWYTRKKVSAGFIKALEVFLALNRNRAIELHKEEE